MQSDTSVSEGDFSFCNNSYTQSVAACLSLWPTIKFQFWPLEDKVWLVYNPVSHVPIIHNQACEYDAFITNREDGQNYENNIVIERMSPLSSLKKTKKQKNKTYETLWTRWHDLRSSTRLFCERFLLWSSKDGTAVTAGSF